MFNERLWKDILINKRADVAEEILLKYAETLEKQEEIYKTASTEELFNLTVNGDDEACAYYIRRRIDEDALAAKDMDYLKASIYNLGFEAALVGGWLYGMKDCIYKDRFMECLSYVVLEQSGNKQAHKLLTKAYKKDCELIQKAEARVIRTAVDHWAVECIGGPALGIRVELNRLGKETGYPDYKLAYLAEAYLTETTGRETDGEPFFVGYLRGKKRDEDFKRVSDNIIDEIITVADKLKIHAVDFFVDGKRFYHYGGGNQTQKAAAKTDRVNIISEVKVDVNLTDSTLQSKVCPYCGGATGEDGVCKSCGKSAQAAEGEGILIKRSKDAEALICTQCGSPVQLEAGGNTAYCTACGTTFLINGNALKFEIPGLNYENIRADMPEGATLPDVKFVRASVADDRITAIMPKNFIVMPDEMRRIKYRANAPKYIYTTPDSRVNLNLNILGPLSEDDVFAFGQQMLGALKSAYPAAKFGEAKRFTLKRNIFFVDFITAGLDQNVYNAMFFFSIDGKQGIGSWNCCAEDRWYWASVFEHAVKTMQY